MPMIAARTLVAASASSAARVASGAVKSIQTSALAAAGRRLRASSRRRPARTPRHVRRDRRRAPPSRRARCRRRCGIRCLASLAARISAPPMRPADAGDGDGECHVRSYGPPWGQPQHPFPRRDEAASPGPSASAVRCWRRRSVFTLSKKPCVCGWASSPQSLANSSSSLRCLAVRFTGVSTSSSTCRSPRSLRAQSASCLCP